MKLLVTCFRTQFCIYLLVTTFAVGSAFATDTRGKALSTDEEQRQRLSEIELTDIQDQSHRPFQETDACAIALIFVSTDCPIANAFQPSLRELTQNWSEKGIPFFMVYCSPKTQTSEIEKHIEEFGVVAPAIHDRTQQLGRLVSAKATPEAILIDANGSIRYRGQINNLYAGYGKKRSKPTEHYLQIACEAILKGETVEVASTKPIGCFIHFVSPEETQP